MRTLLLFFCLLAVVYCQFQNQNGNLTEEIGNPPYSDIEVLVMSTLTVRDKSSGRSIKPQTRIQTKPDDGKESKDGASVSLKRNKRVPRQRFGGFAHQNVGGFPLRPAGNRFPSSSSSAAHASSNAFNSNTPFGSFGASASQSSSQSQAFGPHGFQGAAGQSASQTYYLPNGSKIDVSFSNSFSVNNGRPSGSNSHSLTVTGPDGKIQRLRG